MNISTVSRRDFVQLGRSMKNYIYACIVAVVVGIIAAFSVFESLTYSYSYGLGFSGSPYIDPYVLIEGIIAGIIIVVIVIAVLVLGLYVKMILNIGVVGRSTSDAHLLKAQNYFKWSSVASILEIAITLGCIGGIISLIFVSPLPTATPLQNMYGYTSGISSTYSYIYEIMMFIVLIIIVVAVLGIIACILPILAASALHDWALEYTTGKQSPTCKSLKEGSDLAKIGYILAIFIPVIGQILILVGLWQFGSGLITEFSGEATPVTPIPVAQVPIPQGGYPVQAGFVAPVPSNPIEVNPVTQVRFCSYCGKQIETSNARFCPSCGMSLH